MTHQRIGHGGVVALALCASVFGALAAQAAPITAKEAQAVLYGTDGAEVQVIARDFLTAADADILRQVGASQKYYGAIAVSPSEGLASEATVAGANFHDIESARASALKACNAQRASGSPKCQIVADILPKGWRKGRLQLGADATASFRKSYLAQTKPRAFAISPKTGEWAIGVGEGAGDLATLGCKERAKAKGGDGCILAIED